MQRFNLSVSILLLMTLRTAIITDLLTIVSIYNEFIDTTITMDTEKATYNSKEEWFKNHNDDYPILCDFSNENLTGWASLSKWSEKGGYRKSVELSVYVSKKYQRHGIGKKLVEEAINRAIKKKYHCIISRIDADNRISLELHKKFGFTQVGILKESGFKFGRFIDIIVLQLLI